MMSKNTKFASGRLEMECDLARRPRNGKKPKMLKLRERERERERMFDFFSFMNNDSLTTPHNSHTTHSHIVWVSHMGSTCM
jgi:hypothetical protein